MDYVWGTPAIATPLATFLWSPGQQESLPLPKQSCNSLATVFDDQNAQQQVSGAVGVDLADLHLDSATVEALLKGEEETGPTAICGGGISDLDCMSPTTQGSFTFSTVTEAALAALFDDEVGGEELLVRTQTVSSPAEEAFLTGKAGSLADLVPSSLSKASSDAGEVMSGLNCLANELLQDDGLSYGRVDIGGAAGATAALEALPRDEALAAICSYLETHVGASATALVAIEALVLGNKRAQEGRAKEAPVKRVKLEA